MNPEWPEIKIEEIAKSIAMGPFGSDIKTDNFVPEGVPVIRGGNLSDGGFQDEGFVFLTEEKANQLRTANAFPNDLIFTHRGTLGQISIIPTSAKFPRYVVSQSQMRLTCDTSKVDPSFLYYFFRSSEGQHKLLVNTSQTGVPAISRPVTSLKAIRLNLPPLPEQKAIVRVLGSLDDKIQLNRSMNATLEALAQTMFCAWFVDFEPVKAKAAGLQPVLMDADTAALFPSKFEDSILGPIPKGWKIGRLDEVLELAYGSALKADIRREGNVPVYGSNGQVGWHDEMKVKGPGIVVGRKGNAGTVVWVPTDFFPIDTTFYVVLKDPTQSLRYVFQSLTRQDLPSLGADSAVPGLNRNAAYSREFILPPREISNIFEQMARSFDGQITSNQNRSRTLAQLRDELLPRLISGQVRVAHTES